MALEERVHTLCLLLFRRDRALGNVSAACRQRVSRGRPTTSCAQGSIARGPTTCTRSTGEPAGVFAATRGGLGAAEESECLVDPPDVKPGGSGSPSPTSHVPRRIVLPR